MNLPAIFSIISGALAGVLALYAPLSKTRSLSRWAFSLGMLALSAEQFLTYFATRADDGTAVESLVRWRFVANAFQPGLWLVFAASYSRGDVAKRLKKRALFILPCFVLPLAIVTAFPSSPGRFVSSSPDSMNWVILLDWGGFLINVVFLLAMVGSLLALERTFRASVGTMRWKIKFMLYGLGTLYAARFFTSSQAILAQQTTPYLDALNSVALFICCLFAARSIFRSGSFDIDLYPSQSIISGSVVLSIAGVYLVLVGFLSETINQLGGEQAFAIQAFMMLVALAGLGLFVQADRTRQLIRKFVSRHFQRPLYDYRTLWLKVSEATSNSVREDEICESTTRLIANLFDTKLTKIWLLDPGEKRFKLSASSDKSPPNGQRAIDIDATGIAPFVLSNPDPQSIENGSEKWKRDLLQHNPSSFSDGGDRILVPLTGQGHLVGLLILGDRTNTLRFTQQEFDTLSCIADHIAATLLSAALTRKLEESKEIEAFQTMATFFVHDLKNAVSTLNLMLKNMPHHWDNPEFRNDALRGIGNTSQRITDLITKLSTVRKGLEIRPQQISIPRLVERTTSQWTAPASINLKIAPIDEIEIEADSEKLSSVLLNLIINASEAIHGTGEISLSVQLEESSVLIKVADTGEGMSEAFIRESLFRPFKTTKLRGLGIGMFQSKMIVEAHKGTISVESQTGRGSIFSIRLPASSKIEKQTLALGNQS